MRNRQSRFVVFFYLLIISAFIVGFTNSDPDFFFRIGKSIDIFGRVYREVALNYVDDINPEKLMESGIDGMLETLDPYTNFISEKEAGEVELITSGKYGGIGVTIGMRDGHITVLALMEGYSAQRQGIQPGDRIIAVDNKSIEGMKPDDLRTLTRGEPGTDVRLTVSREGEKDDLEFVLVREEIQLKNISYADFIKDGIVYVKLDRFTRGAGDELRLAIKDLKLKGEITGVILDLRGNPGGLLDVAVDVAEKFLPKGSLVVSTRGKAQESERKYIVAEDPLLPHVPLVILINNQSASASEVVAGAIQDLDRGVIVGERSFGKGLVQTIIPLIYNAQIKITTAKYYTPSGRCIQEIDYMKKNEGGVLAPTPDSLKKKFKTSNGRLESEAGGISPDTVVMNKEHSTFYNELIKRSMFFRFANWYAAGRQEEPKTLSSETLIRDFQHYLDSVKFSYQDEVDLKLKELCEMADKCDYSDSVKESIDQLKSRLTEEKTNMLIKHREEIFSAMTPEIMNRYHGQKGQIEEALKSDRQVIAAIGLIKNPQEYQKHLSGVN